MTFLYYTLFLMLLIVLNVHVRRKRYKCKSQMLVKILSSDLCEITIAIVAISAPPITLEYDS